MKTCFKCNSLKSYSHFYCHPRMGDGYLNKCKQCARIDIVKNRQARLDYYLHYDNKRNRSPHRIAARKGYIKTEEGKKARARANRNYKINYPEKYKATRALGNALRNGRIQKLPCEKCGSKIKVEAHHRDYSKPLYVVWLCEQHHKQIHRDKHD